MAEVHPFERFPLFVFSVYTQLQCDALYTQANIVRSTIEGAFQGERDIDALEFNKAYGAFWLWALGAYEVVRTMSQHHDCFEPAYARRLVETKKHIATYRVPFAKQELKNDAGTLQLAEASIAAIDPGRRDFAFAISEKHYWMKVEMSLFEETLRSATLDTVLRRLEQSENAARTKRA